MKKIFIYYSLTGNGRMVANYLEDKNIDCLEVISKRKMPKNRFLCILKGGFLAGLNRRDKLVDFDLELGSYNEVIIGSPIWNDHLTPAINTVLDKLDIGKKKLSFILYSGSGSAPKTVDKLNNKYKNSKIIILREPKRHGYELKKLDKI